MGKTDEKLKIYRSSAGSGKTFTLVTEYLKLVLSDPSSYRKILAITFTNKATEEMKTRIIAQLVKISQGTETGYIQQHLPFLSPQEAEEKAKKALSNILHDYSGFAISTIDSFFSSMVRNLARELNLPMRFEMELGQDHVIRQITFDLLEDIETDEGLSDWLKEFLMDMLDQEKGWKIEPRIHETARQLFTDIFRETHEKGNAIPGKSLIVKLKDIRNAMIAQMVEFGNQLEKIMAQHGLNVEDFANGKGGPAGFAKKLKQSASVFPEFGSRFLKAAEDPKGWYSKSSPNASVIAELAETTLVKWARSVLDHLEANGPAFYGASETLKLIYLTGLLGRLQNHLVQYREETDTILLSDVNHMLRKAIGPSDAPFIYEKAGNRFRHFMLDEFQDTSSTQWSNMLPLLINSLSTANSSLIVGDAKQSIYRWRGGRMDLLQTGVEKDLEAFKSMIKPEVLNKNWRSRETVVSFNNNFFPAAASLLKTKLNTATAELLSNVYTESNVHQHFMKGGAGEGYLNIRFYDKKDQNGDQEEEDDQNSKQSWKFRSMEDTCNKILELADKGYALGEMVILCRTNQDALYITSHLLSRGITKLISPESLLLEGSADIRFLISLFRFIENRDDQIALAHICHHYDKGSTPLHTVFSASREVKLGKLPKSFLSRLNEFRTITLYETTEELCRIFGLTDQADAYVQRFHDLIQEYVNSNPSGIGDFLAWWDENRQTEKCSVILPPDKHSIRIMSIHKSKGLEFKVVFIPICNWEFTPKHFGHMWVHSEEAPFNELSAHLVHPVKELSRSVFKHDYENEYGLQAIDNLNLMYVAFTRAEEQLYIHTTKPPKKIKEDSQYTAATLLYYTLQQQASIADNLHENQGEFIEIGKLPEKSEAHEETTESPTLHEWISVPWKDKLWLGVNKKKVSLSDPEPHETGYGNLFHETVSTINSIDENWTPESHVDKNIPHAEASIKTRITGDIRFVTETGTQFQWYSASSKSYSEKEILDADGKILRPDRVVITSSGEVHVIDYKTGAEDEKHFDQVRKYGQLLNAMGYKKARLFVIYPALKKTVEVPQ